MLHMMPAFHTCSPITARNYEHVIYISEYNGPCYDYSTPL